MGISLETKNIGEVLDSLGEERIREKEERMQNLLKVAEPDEALYREIMLALGYKNNKTQFLELAMILPYSEIKKLDNKKIIESALLYRAGLSNDKKGLPEDFDDSLRMNKSVWRYKGTRPANFPERRIRGAAQLLFYSLKQGGICPIFEKVIINNYVESPTKEQAMELSEAISEIFIKTKSAGKMRAVEICFNIILPFFMAFFQNRGEVKYIDFLKKIFEIHPPLPENSITKKVKRQLFGDKTDTAKEVIKSVRNYFGLIHLYHKNKTGGNIEPNCLCKS